jgi:hypothetical protein
MADVKKVIEIDIDVNSEGLDDVNKKLAQTSQSVEKVGDSQANTNELVMKGGEVLDQYTGGLFGLARKWWEMGKAAKTSLNGIKTGLISTGIGALVVALGLVVAYWDEITAALGFANDEQEDLNEQTKQYNLILEKQVDIINRTQNTRVQQLKEEALARGEILSDDEARLQVAYELKHAADADLENARKIRDEKIDALALDDEAIAKIDQKINEQQKYFKKNKDLSFQEQQEVEMLAQRRIHLFEEEKKKIKEGNAEKLKGIQEAQIELDKATETQTNAQNAINALEEKRNETAMKAIEEELAARDAAADKLKALLQKYYDLALSLDQAHQLALIENDRERQLKALEFELENNKRSIDNSEFTAAQKNIIKEKYDQAYQDKKEALEAQWAREELLRLQGYLDEANKVREDNERAFYENLENVREEMRQKGLTPEQLEIEAAEAKYFELIELAKQYNEDVSDLEEAQAKEVNDIKQKYADEQRRQELEDERWLMNAKLDLTIQSLQLADEITNLFVAKNEKQARTQFNISKGLRLAEATISAIQGAQNAFTSAAANVPATAASFGAYPFIQAGLAAGFGAVKVAMIAKQKFQSTGGGGDIGSITGGGGAAPMPAPQFNIVGAGATNQLSQSIADQNAKPVKAYVVANDVTTMQALDRNRRSQSAFP